MQQFARERGVDWNWYYDPALSFGIVTATDTFDIPDTVLKLSQQEGDYVRITHTDDTYTDYTIVSHDRLREYNTGNYVARVGSTLRFNNAFTSTSPQLGGEITAPVYEFPEEFSADSDDLDLPDPNWLVFVTAADKVKNDVTRKDLRSDLIAQANESMLAMKEDNEGQVSVVLTPWSPTSHTEDSWVD